MMSRTARDFNEIALHFNMKRKDVCNWRDSCKQEGLFRTSPFDLQAIADWRRKVEAERSQTDVAPAKSTELPLDSTNRSRPATAIGASNTSRESLTRADRGFADIRDDMNRRKQHEERAKKLYPLNLFIILLFLMLMSLWFYRHINALFLKTLFVGVPLSSWTIWKLLQSWLPERLKFDRSALTTRLLLQPFLTRYLAGTLVLPLILLSATSSVFIEHGGGSQAYTVEVWTVDPKTKQAKELLMDRLTVSSAHKVKGQPFFFSVDWLSQPAEIEVRVVKPFGFRDESRTLHPWSRVYLRTEAFKRGTYRAIRLIPNQGLLKLPPRIDKSDEHVYSVRVFVDGQKHTVIPGLMLECIYLGQSNRSIEWLIQEEPIERRMMIVRNGLFRTGMRGDDLQTFSNLLASSYRKFGGTHLKPRSQIVVEVWSDSTDGKKSEWMSEPLVISDEGGIQTILLEADDGS